MGASMRCEKFDSLPIGSQVVVYSKNPVPSNTWQLPNGDFWGAKFITGNNIGVEDGIAKIDGALKAKGSGHEVSINNINLCFGANLGQVLKYIKFKFGKNGGNLNLAINKTFNNFCNFGEFHGKIIGGVKIKVLSSGLGNDSGEVEFSGIINDNRWWGHLAIGGQELWIDDLYWE